MIEPLNHHLFDSVYGEVVAVCVLYFITNIIYY